MKIFLISAFLVASASAFSTPTMTLALGGKAYGGSLGPKGVTEAVAAPIPRGSSSVKTVASRALPYGNKRAPAILDGTTPGDSGFDPVFLSVQDKFANLFTLQLDSFTWMREAELMNGRNAMMGVLGMIVPGLLGITANPLEATATDCWPVVLTMGWMEWFRINNILKAGADYKAGDMQKWGQGDDERFNPFGFDYSEEGYAKIQTSEVKHCRLAMIGFLGLYLQAAASGQNIVTQLSGSLSAPDYYAKVGYFFPEGI